jgi:hypothetical protein
MSYQEQLEKRCEELEELLAVAQQRGSNEINDLFIRYLAVTLQAAFKFKDIHTEDDRRDFIRKKIKLIKVLQEKSRDFKMGDTEKMIKEEMKNQYIVP